ncbi:ParB/RepB/Spo0J family partition protein [Rahnella aceris]|uniref:ParB/RepB/Spo0J family partition protein n=1 Tax=Rahnella sp. (strain Y9602) TaxID=2703885 RepID=UPI001C252D21|nr:ParB/RepB/Spo0J family partition protein [Rahnella aceris]MBU9852010.1 ParB/RepB/Spo0J family partition protein [Rahnella aceris]MBU9861191.1 ParB/RepB/Spo0J family partition protein [Rahnella aceris]
MSVTESNAVSTTRKAAKNPKNSAQSAAVEQALANTPVEMVPLSQLALSPLNVRKVSPDPVKLQELADSIRAVGVLQNLIVHLLPDGLLGTAAGGRRFRALNILLNGGMITADYAVPVKTVSEEMAKIVSATENFQHEEMHPADQIAVFGEMSREGKTAAQIAGVLGYSTKHVQKFLRLAGMAPALLAALAEDKLNVDQLQALSASEDQERQLNVWENAFGYYRNPKELREAVLKGEVPAAGNRLLDFVGREAYEQAGGGFRYDLFSDEGFIGDTVLLHTVARQKLADIAAGIAQAEGWLWSEGRPEGVSTYGEDAERYLLLKQPAGELTPEERARFDALDKQLETLSEQDDDEDADHDALELAADACQADMDAIEAAANIRAWDADVRAHGGVVVSLLHGAISVRRGVMLRSDLPEIAADDKTGVNQHLSSIRTQDSGATPEAKPLSAALVKSLSSERTLAVQAALAAQPQMALVIFVHDCLKSTFNYHSFVASTLKVSLHAHTGNLLDNAPTANDGLAMQHLNAMHDAWQAQLPDNWHESWDWLLAWDTQQLISVMGYCLAKTLNGASERLSHKDSKAGKELEPVEAMLGFTLRDWWLPTKANFFGRISREQISDSLSQAGLDGAARDVLKMKKAEAAELAEEKITLTGWVPDCLIAVCEETVQVDAGTDTETEIVANIAA